MAVREAKAWQKTYNTKDGRKSISTLRLSLAVEMQFTANYNPKQGNSCKYRYNLFTGLGEGTPRHTVLLARVDPCLPILRSLVLGRLAEVKLGEPALAALAVEAARLAGGERVVAMACVS